MADYTDASILTSFSEIVMKFHASYGYVLDILPY